MFWAIFSTFLSSLSKVFFKKTTQYNIKNELNDLFWHFWAILWLIVIIFIWKFNLLLDNYFDYVLIVISFILFFLTIKISHYVVKQETVSALIPYENLGKVLTVLFWVFLLNEEISNISLVMFVWVVILILWFSLDLKHLKFSKNILLYCLTQVFTAIANLLIGYILINTSSLDYYSVYTIFSLVFLIILCWYMWLYPQAKWLDKWYYLNRGLSSLNWISWIISILLIKELWLSVTTLLSFLWIWISLISSYIIFKDIPTKKNILLTVAILSLVWVWYAFK
jgi:hypothetical protein